MGLTSVESDYGLYLRRQEGEISMLLTVYMGNLLLMGPPAACEKTHRHLQETF
jgi:hypothetical protein